jgi:hypothetical protein
LLIVSYFVRLYEWLNNEKHQLLSLKTSKSPPFSFLEMCPGTPGNYSHQRVGSAANGPMGGGGGGGGGGRRSNRDGIHQYFYNFSIFFLSFF